MDNLSGSAKNYYSRNSSPKAKKKEREIVEVKPDPAELQTVGVELKIKLDDLIERNDYLYGKFSKKQLNDFGTLLRMAKNSLKTLLDEIKLN